MSALGQKQTFALQQLMSALPPIADTRSAPAHGAYSITSSALRRAWQRPAGPLLASRLERFA